EDGDQRRGPRCARGVSRAARSPLGCPPARLAPDAARSRKRRMGTTAIRLVSAAAALLAAAVCHAQPAELYQRNCAACHDAGLERAPSREAFGSMAPERILDAMERGSMISMAVTMSHEQRRGLAEHLAGRPLSDELVT